jgi:RNA polymerase sigma factor (sigma-70 family)
LQASFSIPHDAERLFLAFRARIYRWAFGLCRRDADALDILQEVFVRLLRSRPQFDEERSAVAWLRRTTVRVAVDQWRTTASREAARLRSATERPIRLAETTLDAQAVERADTLRAAIERLSEQQRLVIVAKLFDEMTFAAIATELDVSTPTVKTHYLRGLTALRERLGAEALADERAARSAPLNAEGSALTALAETRR